jgi:O-antigen/teichoic acid export membrane protein
MNYKNVVANFLGRSWSILILLFLTPFYIEILGFESYGLIGFFTTVQAIATLLEVGFPLAINKTCAQFTAGKISAEETSVVIKGFEKFFIAASLLFCFVSLPFAYLLTEYWFEFSVLTDNDVNFALICIFVLTAFRFPIGLYLGVLTGLQKQVQVNVLSIIFSSLRLGGAALVIMFWSPDIGAFFVIQIFFSLVEVFVVREISWKSHGYFRKDVTLSWDLVKKHTSFAVEVGVITVLGIVLLQMDKIVVSGMLSLRDFGHYSLISMISAGLATLGYPVATASFPHFVKLIAENDKLQLRRVYFSYFRLVTVIMLPITASLAFFPQEILEFYTQSSSLEMTISNAFYIFILASFFSSMRPISYGLMLALNKQTTVIKYYFCLLVTYPAIIFFLAGSFDIVGVALAFLIMQLVSVFVFLVIALKALDENKMIYRIFVVFVFPIGLCFSVGSIVAGILSLGSLELHIITSIVAVYIPIFLVLVLALYSKSEIISGISFIRNLMRYSGFNK